MKTLRTFGIIILFIGLSLVIFGAVLTKGDFSKVKGFFIIDDQYEKVEKKGEEEINSVNLSLVTNDVIIYKSSDETYATDYYVSEDDTIDFSIIDKQLVMKGKKTYKIFNWGFKTSKVSKVNLYLPKSFEGIINLKNSTGDVKISDITLQELAIESSTGDVTLSNVNIVNGFTFSVSTGEVNLDKVNTPFIDGNTSTGDVEILNSIVTTKIDINASTGNLYLNNVDCGKIDTNTSTGNIKINIVGQQADYRLNLDTSSGDIYLQGNKMGDHITTINGTKSINASTSTGNITINFS